MAIAVVIKLLEKVGIVIYPLPFKVHLHSRLWLVGPHKAISMGTMIVDQKEYFDFELRPIVEFSIWLHVAPYYLYVSMFSLLLLFHNAGR